MVRGVTPLLLGMSVRLCCVACVLRVVGWLRACVGVARSGGRWRSANQAFPLIFLHDLHLRLS